MPLSGFVTDVEIDAWLTEGGQALHEKLVSAYGENYSIAIGPVETITIAIAQNFGLPAVFFKMLGVEMLLGGRVYTLEPYNESERNAYRQGGDWSSWSYEGSCRGRPRYLVRGGAGSGAVGSNLHVAGAPVGAQIRYFYAPEFEALSGPGTAFVTFPNGWEKYMVAYAAAQCLDKEESDSSKLYRLLDKWDAELETLKYERDASFPQQTVDMDVVRIPGMEPAVPPEEP